MIKRDVKFNKLRTYTLIEISPVDKKHCRVIQNLYLYELKGYWKCQGPPKTITLGSGATKLLKWNQEKYELIFKQLNVLKRPDVGHRYL